jgi:hypothetical protein
MAGRSGNAWLRAYLGTLAILKEFKIVVSILVLGTAFTLGLMDVPGFQVIVDGLVALTQAGIQGIGL